MVGGQDIGGKGFIHIHRTQPKQVANLEFSVPSFYWLHVPLWLSVCNMEVEETITVQRFKGNFIP